MSPEGLQTIYLFLFKALLVSSKMSPLIKNELDAMFADKFLRGLIGFTVESALVGDGHEYSMRQLGQVINSLNLLNPQCAKSIEQTVSMILYETGRVFYDRIVDLDLLEKTKIRFQKHFSDNFNKRFAT